MRLSDQRNHGIALMLVLAVVAMASLIGFAMLSTTSLQTQVSDNAKRAAMADYLVESAAQTAMYYLQYPSKMPSSWAQSGYLINARGATIPGEGGSFDIDATSTANRDECEIRTVGRSAGSTPITHSGYAKVQLSRATVTMACAFGGAITLPSQHTLNGPVQAANLTLGGGTINGAIDSSNSATNFVVPTAQNINWYGAGDPVGTYTMPDGTIGTPQVISGPLLLAPAAQASNPGRVFYSLGNLTISAGMTIDGTIVVRNGRLTIAATGATVTLTPRAGFPALIVDDVLTVWWKTTSFNANGLVWLRNGTNWTGGNNLASCINIKGALLMPAGALFGSTTGAVVVTYTPGNLDLPDLCTSPQPVTSVKIASWKQ